MADYIAPNTDALLTITVKEAGVPRDDATVTAKVYSPKGQVVANGVSLAAQGSGSGAYVLSIDNDWSVIGGKPVEGEYVAEITAVRGSFTSTNRFRYTVRFDDDS